MYQLTRSWQHRLVRTVLGCFAMSALLAAGPLGASEPEQRTKLVKEQYFLHGQAEDGIMKLAGGDGPTFSQEEPAEEVPIVQFASLLGNLDASFSAYWVGEFVGIVNGELDLSLYITQPNAIDLEVRSGDVILFSGQRSLTGPRGDNGAVQANIAVPVEGDVDGELLVRIKPPIGVSSDFGILYGSVDYKSGLVLPTIVPCEEDDDHPDCQEE